MGLDVRSEAAVCAVAPPGPPAAQRDAPAAPARPPPAHGSWAGAAGPQVAIDVAATSDVNQPSGCGCAFSTASGKVGGGAFRSSTPSGLPPTPARLPHRPGVDRLKDTPIRSQSVGLRIKVGQLVAIGAVATSCNPPLRQWASRQGLALVPISSDHDHLGHVVFNRFDITSC